MLLLQIPSLPGYASLTRLEVSYNQIRSLAPLTSLAATPEAAAAGATADSSNSSSTGAAPLAELYCASNKVSAIEGLAAFDHLTLLELGSNRVREICGLQV